MGLAMPDTTTHTPDLPGLPDHATRLLAAWEHSRTELLNGRICSMVAMRERRLILQEAEELGVTEQIVSMIEEGCTRA